MKTAPQIILAAAATIATLDATLAQLQAKLDAIPAQETALAEDRTKTPSQIREGLAALRDCANDLRIEQKRAMEDRNNVLAEAAAAFNPCAQIITEHFKRLADEQVNKARAALAPFFDGSGTPMEKALDEMPSVQAAQKSYIYCFYSLAGENVEERLANFCRVIQINQLDKP